jgi:hypothetical protein
MMLALEYLIYHVKPYGGDSNLWTTRKLDTVTVRNLLDSSKSANAKSMPGKSYGIIILRGVDLLTILFTGKMLQIWSNRMLENLII